MDARERQELRIDFCTADYRHRGIARQYQCVVHTPRNFRAVGLPRGIAGQHNMAAAGKR